MKKVLVVSAHPDDETLGAGGSILRWRRCNHKVYWLNMTDMQTEYGFESSCVRRRSAEISKVAEAYGVDEFFNLKLKPAGLDQYPRAQLVAKTADIILKVKPDTLLIPFRGDVHSDHKVAFDVVISASKTFRYPFVKKILMYETISETEFAPPSAATCFQPNCFVDISDHLKDKIAIMQIYKSELGQHPFPRSSKNIEALAIFRGATAGFKYAESFVILKEIW